MNPGKARFVSSTKNVDVFRTLSERFAQHTEQVTLCVASFQFSLESCHMIREGLTLLSRHAQQKKELLSRLQLQPPQLEVKDNETMGKGKEEETARRRDIHHFNIFILHLSTVVSFWHALQSRRSLQQLTAPLSLPQLLQFL